MTATLFEILIALCLSGCFAESQELVDETAPDAPSRAAPAYANPVNDGGAPSGDAGHVEIYLPEGLGCAPSLGEIATDAGCAFYCPTRCTLPDSVGFVCVQSDGGASVCGW
jgi:hypothetical protein